MINNIVRKVKKIPWHIGKVGYRNNESYGNLNHNEICEDTLVQVSYYKALNAGDTVLSKCVRKTFETYMQANWYLQDIPKSVRERDINIFNRTKGIIIGGGGLFLPDTNANQISGWQWAVSKDLLNAINKPVIVFSVGYNYFPGQQVSSLFCENIEVLVKKSLFVGLRNRGSVEAIKRLLPDELKEKVVYQPCTTTLIRRLFKDIPTKKDTQNIAINIAFDRADRRFGKNKDMILSQVACFVDKISKRGYKPIIVYHCTEDNKIKPYLEKISASYDEMNLADTTPDKVFDFYNSVDLVCGMRGHAQMIPFGLNCEIISLGTHDKMKWFLDDIGCTDWYVDLREDPDGICDRLMSTFIRIHEVERERTKKRLLDAQDKLMDITNRNMHIICDILNN